MLTFGSLFTGIGGLDLGLERAGLVCKWQVEIDEFCRRVLERHWPGVRRHADVRSFPPQSREYSYSWRGMPTGPFAPDVCRDRTVEEWIVDLLCGGFPCQPFSSASRGRKRGTADDRWLWPEMFRVVRVIQPAWVLCENVTQLDGLGLEQVVSDLEGDGYEVSPPFEIPSCAIGRDHWRARLWILGYADRYRKPRLPVDAEVARLPRDRCEPRRVGEANGVSDRMDRLAAVGNAVDPGIGEMIGTYILQSLAA